MTDISVIKMIISVAVWRIYPSWVNDKLRAWEGLGHSGMFWARLSRDDFHSKLEIISFLSRVVSVSKSFSVSRAFQRLGAKCSSSGAFGLDDVLGLFLKTPLRHGAFLRTLTTTTSISWNFPFLFSKAEPVLLAWQHGDPNSEQSTLVMVRRKLEWKLDFRALARSSAEVPSIVDAIGTSRVRWSMVQKRKKKNTRKSACDCAKSRPFIINKPASFEEPVSETRRRYRFALRCFRGRRCTAAGRSGCSAGTTKKGSLPWHFRCWSLRRNELECTNLVHSTGALHRFSSRDAIIVVGSVLEKHFDGDFTPDQEKEITFKRWPPGYQSWKLGLALNGLNRCCSCTVCCLNNHVFHPKLLVMWEHKSRKRSLYMWDWLCLSKVRARGFVKKQMIGSGKVRRQNVGFALQNVCLNLKILQHSECQVTLSFTCAKPLALLWVFLTQNIA